MKSFLKRVWFPLILAVVMTGLFSSNGAGATSTYHAHADWSGTYYGVTTRLFPNGGWYNRNEDGSAFLDEKLTASGFLIGDVGLAINNNGPGTVPGCANGYFGYMLQGQTKWFCTQGAVGQNGTTWDDTIDVTLQVTSTTVNAVVQDENNAYVFCGVAGRTCITTCSGGCVAPTKIQDYNTLAINSPISSIDYHVGFDDMQYYDSGYNLHNLGASSNTQAAPANIDASSGANGEHECATTNDISYVC